METHAQDPDAGTRLAAFSRLRALMLANGTALPWAAISEGFAARGQRFLFASAAEGIFRPAGMTGVLSLKTVVPTPKGRVWYHDQAAPDLHDGSELFWYAFRGIDPDNTRNRWLHDAMMRQLPLIYFFGIAPGLYEPLFPAFVVEWDAKKLSCGLSFSTASVSPAALSAPPVGERRYALRTVQQRLHQYR